MRLALLDHFDQEAEILRVHKEYLCAARPRTRLLGHVEAFALHEVIGFLNVFHTESQMGKTAAGRRCAR